MHARVEAQIYAESGRLGVEENEASSVAELRAVGTGALATLSLSPFRDSQPSGAVLLLGATSEYRAQRASCAPTCEFGPEGFVGGSVWGGRLGFGYEDSGVGVRGGVLVRGGSISWVRTLVLPDVAVRIGPRDSVNASFGFGAYDAATSVRPGLYAGLAATMMQRFTLAAHAGAHCDFGACGDSGLQLDTRLDLALEYAISPAWRASLGGGVDFTRLSSNIGGGHLGVSASF